MADALYIAAKAPRIGLAKTRLGQALGHELALTLYRAFLSDLATRFASAPFRIGWYITPPDAWADIAPLVSRPGRAAHVLIQGAGDWTERQRMLFAGAAARREERTILIASDSPQITLEVVAEAFRQLDRHDLVFGPVYDGGYYLIGMRGWHDILQGIPMSTGTVLRDLIERATRGGLSAGLVETTFDVDEIEDLRRLRELIRQRPDLPATRAALEALGLLGQAERAIGKTAPEP